MSLKVATLECIIFFITNIIVHTTGDATMLSVIHSLKDTQELLDAYNDGDYVKTGIKLIDVKLKADPPEKGSREEELLLSCRQRLIKIYPYYFKVHEGVKNTPTFKDIRELEYEEIIEQAVNTLDSILYEMGMSIDNFEHYGSFVKPLESELQEENEKVPPSIIKEAKINDPTEQLSNIFNNFAWQVADAFSQAVDDSSVGIRN